MSALASNGLPMAAFAIPEDPYLYFGNLAEQEPHFRIPNFVGLALHPKGPRDIAHDLRNPLPFRDGSIRKIQAQDVLEHLPKDTVPAILDEIFRVLAPGGIFRLSVPDYHSPLLKRRSVYDSEGRVLADLMMATLAVYDRQTGSAKAEFAQNGDAHLWFPTYSQILDLLIRSEIRKCSAIHFHHYFRTDDEYVVEPFTDDEMPVYRCPPRDMRADGKPVSIVADFIK